MHGIRLNLGCGRSPLNGWLNIDSMPLPGVDMVVNLEDGKLDLPDNSVSEIYASHLIEHIANPLKLMQELHRVAMPNAVATFKTPYGSSDAADEDPTHVRRYYWGSWGYFGQPYYWRADYGYRGDWLVAHVTLEVSSRLATSDFNTILQEINEKRNVVKEMTAVLRATKPIREPLRELQRLTPIQYSFT